MFSICIKHIWKHVYIVLVTINALWNGNLYSRQRRHGFNNNYSSNGGGEAALERRQIGCVCGSWKGREQMLDNLIDVVDKVNL